MQRIEFDVPMIPTRKGRPRATVRGGFARIYTDDKTDQAERDFIAHATPHAPASVIENPVALELGFVFPIPQSLKKTEWGQPNTKGGDVDNYAKLIMDAITRSGQFWRDDKQVALLRAFKVYGEKPCVQVRIVELSPTAKLMLR